MTAAREALRRALGRPPVALRSRPADPARRRAALAGAGVAAALGLVGWAAGSLARPDAPAPPAAPSVTVGALRVELAHAWTPTGSPHGLEVPGARSYTSESGRATALLVDGPAADASLIPAALRSRLPRVLPEPRRATLAGLEAWRYGPLRGDGTVTRVLVAPTTAGMVALACVATSAAADCDDGVRAVTSEDARALTPAPDLAFRLMAGPVLERLDARRTAGRRRLARRPGAARGLAAAHRGAATALAPFAEPAVVAALRDAAQGYDALAAAGRDRNRFIHARRAIARADAALAKALD